MRTDDFWAVIARATADRPGSPAQVAERAAADLAARDPEEIVAWGRHLDKVMVASGTQDLWAAAYLINGGCSEDGFDGFRGGVIAHGRDAGARSVREPDSLAEMPAGRGGAGDGAGLEGGGGLALAAAAHSPGPRARPPTRKKAYAQATGSDLPTGKRPVTRPEAADLWDFDNEEEMQKRLPRLSALFLEPPD